MRRLVCVILVLASLSFAQEQPPAAATTPTAAPADVKSVDAILSALYDVISGPAGKARDWNRFRSLFVPGARLIPLVQKKEGGYETRVMSPDDYVTRAQGAFDKQGFFEHEISRRTHRWSHLVEVFSVYESRHAADDAKPFARGINSIQLMYDGGRWWVVTILWQAETPQNRLPARLLAPQPRGAARKPRP
ncbi:MAG TPA: hypothetical protein VFU76_01360 [Terriglobales bacterium]|nr:hypothetical protein [Terriglobales bacterium]